METLTEIGRWMLILAAVDAGFIAGLVLDRVITRRTNQTIPWVHPEPSDVWNV